MVVMRSEALAMPFSVASSPMQLQEVAASELEAQLPFQVIERDHDVLPIGGPLLEPGIPSLNMWNIRPVDIQIEVPVK